MMDTLDLLDLLLGIESKEERRALLETHKPLVTEFFESLRERVRETLMRDGQEALRIADIGIEAAELAAEQEGVAQAWWARGNALLILGRYDDVLAAYSAAISIFSEGTLQASEVAKLQVNYMLPLMWTGRHAEARTIGQGALKMLTNQGDSEPLANALLNLGVCAFYQGDRAQALELTERAALTFTRLGNAVEAARCRVTQACALEYLDRFAESEALLRQTLQVFAEHRAWVPWARAALNLGILCARLADYQAALNWLEQSRQGFLRVGIQTDAAVVDLYRTQCLLDVSLLPEAAALARTLLSFFTQLKMPRQVARVALLLAGVHSRRHEIDRAHQELERARRIFRAEGDALEVALLDVQHAALLRERGQPGTALRLAYEAAETLDVRLYPLRHAEAHLTVAACCEDLGRIDEAQMAYRTAWTAGVQILGTTEPLPMLAYRIAHARGVIAEAGDRRSLARGEYDRAVGYLSQIARGLGLEELRGGYLADKRVVYESAMRLALEDDRIVAAFRYSELARAGALRDLLAGRRYSTREAGEDTLVQELKARWAWRLSGLNRPVDLLAEAEEDIAIPEDRASRLKELADIEQQLSDAYRRRRLADPRFAVMEQGEVPEAEQIQQLLPDETALLSFDHVDGDLLAFVITYTGIDVVPLAKLKDVRWKAAALGHALEEIRLFDDPVEVAMLEEDLLIDVQALYQSVLAEPLSRLAPDVRHLLIVPCDALNTLPLEAFHDGERHLIERYEVSYLPSASFLTALSPRHASRVGSSLVMAHSWEGRLPLTLTEAEDVARVITNGTSQSPVLLTEAQATVSALQEQAGSAELIHLATHGAFRADAPLFSSLNLHDGLLTVNDVYGLNLDRAALVTLSACQTGLGQSWGGEVLGLAHAFFAAGTPALVVSRWRVEDQVTARLMQDFYSALVQGETIAEALRTAQVHTLTGHPHAGYWAAFAIWGRGGDPVFPADDGGITA